MQVLSHIKTEEYKNQLERKKHKDLEVQILKTEPEPNKKEFICQICKARFDNYLEHIKSTLHERNKVKYLNSFKKIKLTFKRITDYNNSKKNNINTIKDGKNEKTHNINIDDNIGTTKDESFSLNDDNKITNQANITKFKKISQNYNEESIIKRKDISVKDILNILDTIEEKGNNNKLGNFRKRKKKDKNKYFLTENYIQDLKFITGKIHHFNDLMKKK